NNPDAAASVNVVGDLSRNAIVDTQFSPLVVQVLDQFGNPVSGVTVDFAGAGSGLAAATFLGKTFDVTNGMGEATVTVAANTKAGGPYTVTATVAGVDHSALFSLTNKPDAAASVNVVGDSSRRATVGKDFTPLVVQVLDKFKNPVSG